MGCLISQRLPENYRVDYRYLDRVPEVFITRRTVPGTVLRDADRGTGTVPYGTRTVPVLYRSHTHSFFPSSHVSSFIAYLPSVTVIFASNIIKSKFHSSFMHSSSFEKWFCIEFIGFTFAIYHNGIFPK